MTGILEPKPSPPLVRRVEVLPTKATFAPSDTIEIDVSGVTDPTDVMLWHLDRLVATVTVEPGETATFPPQPEGGYGIEAGGETSALDVLADPLSRPRYGFVSHGTSGLGFDESHNFRNDR